MDSAEPAAVISVITILFVAMACFIFYIIRAVVKEHEMKSQSVTPSRVERDLSTVTEETLKEKIEEKIGKGKKTEGVDKKTMEGAEKKKKKKAEETDTKSEVKPKKTRTKSKQEPQTGDPSRV